MDFALVNNADLVENIVVCESPELATQLFGAIYKSVVPVDVSVPGSPQIGWSYLNGEFSESLTDESP